MDWCPPHAIFRVLIRWGRFVFEPHASPSSSSSSSSSSSEGKKTNEPLSSLYANNKKLSQQQQQQKSSDSFSGHEYRIVWFRAIDGVAIGHTKWCSLTVLHNVVSVVDFQSAPAVVDIASGYMANPATRVILLQLQQRNVDPTTTSLLTHHHYNKQNNDNNNNNIGDSTSTTTDRQYTVSQPIVAATGAIDIGMFLGSPPRSYVVTLEASFFAVGKLHMNLVVKEPKVDEEGQPAAQHQQQALNNTNKNKQAGSEEEQNQKLEKDIISRNNVEHLTVLVVDSMEGENYSSNSNGGGGGGGDSTTTPPSAAAKKNSSKVGVYGVARLLQDQSTEDRRFPLPGGSSYQLKVSFVLDPNYVAKPQLVKGAFGVSGERRDKMHNNNNNNHHHDDKDSNNHNNGSDNNERKRERKSHHKPLRDSNKDANRLFLDAPPPSHKSKYGRVGDVVFMDDEDEQDQEEDDDQPQQQQKQQRKTTTFRTLLRSPHDGRVMWRAGIAFLPCTKVKFSLYRETTKIATTAIMASQLSVVSMPHDFALPMKVKMRSGNTEQVHQMQINMTLSEHTLDTVSGEVIGNALSASSSSSSNTNTSHQGTSSHVCMLPGTDLMVMLRGYETIGDPKKDSSSFSSSLSHHRFFEDSPTSSSRQPQKKERRHHQQEEGEQQQQQEEEEEITKPSKNSSGERFSTRAPIVIPNEISKHTLPCDEAFVTQSVDTDVLRAENNRLLSENLQLRTALTEQEERIKEQENYILTLLENQGIEAIEGEEGGGGGFLTMNEEDNEWLLQQAQQDNNNNNTVIQD